MIRTLTIALGIAIASPALACGVEGKTPSGFKLELEDCHVYSKGANPQIPVQVDENAYLGDEGYVAGPIEAHKGLKDPTPGGVKLYVPLTEEQQELPTVVPAGDDLTYVPGIEVPRGGKGKKQIEERVQ
jgi:hypothetical protein